MEQRYQVMIVGGGPVGVALAVDLGLRGISCALVERYLTTQQIPKGQNLIQRSMEHFAPPESIARTLTGTSQQILDRLEAIEATCIDNAVIPVTDAQGAKDLIEGFGRAVIPKLW